MITTNFRLISAIVALREMQRDEDIAWQDADVTERCARCLDAMVPPPPKEDDTQSKGNAS
jgi:hypothetical protein